MKNSTPQLDALTCVRFFLASWVVIYHQQYFTLKDVVFTSSFLKNALMIGYIPVNAFFVLSGFVMAYSYRDRNWTKNSVLSYFKARFVRIYPSYFLGLLLVAPFILVPAFKHIGPSVGRQLGLGLAAVSLLQAWLPQTALAWNPPSWSLSAETFFYLCFPLLVPLILKRDRLTAVGITGLLWLVSLAVLCFVVYKPIPGFGELAATDQAPTSRIAALFMYNPALHLNEFVIGILAARFFLADRGAASQFAFLTIGGCLSVLALVILFADKIPRLFVQNAGLAPLFAILIFQMAKFGELKKSTLSSVFITLGHASYSLYILHIPLAYCVARSFNDPRGVLPFAGYYTLCILAAVLVFIYVERPIGRWVYGTGRRSDEKQPTQYGSKD